MGHSDRRRLSDVLAHHLPLLTMVLVIAATVPACRERDDGRRAGSTSRTGPAAPGRAAPDAEAGPPGDLLLVGDSLFWQAAGELRRALGGEGWDVTVAAQPGAGLGGGGYTDVRWSRQLDELLDGLDPELAVVELGTNGCGPYCGSPSDAIDTVMARLADVPTVLWLTVRTRAPRPDAPGEINDALRAAAARYPQLELLAYDRWLRGRPGLVAEDGVHLTPSGQRVVAENVRRAVRARTTGPEASRTS